MARYTCPDCGTRFELAQSEHCPDCGRAWFDDYEHEEAKEAMLDE